MTNMFIGVEPSEMCDQHLLGLNKELHQIKGTIEKHRYGEAIVRGGFVQKPCFVQKIPVLFKKKVGLIE